jgi:hypothetical protein
MTSTRLHEHQVEGGVAREERFAGIQRRIVNQHRIGIVSFHPERYIKEEI